MPPACTACILTSGSLATILTHCWLIVELPSYFVLLQGGSGHVAASPSVTAMAASASKIVGV